MRRLAWNGRWFAKVCGSVVYGSFIGGAMVCGTIMYGSAAVAEPYPLFPQAAYGMALGGNTTLIAGDRVDSAFRGAESLQSAGLEDHAQRVREAFGMLRQPMHYVMFLENRDAFPGVQFEHPSIQR